MIQVCILFVGACSLGVNFDILEDGDCPEGTKACNARCVGFDDPATGCAQSGCFPCNLPHALAVCGPEGQCVKAACIADWADCDGNPLDCETDVAHDANNCSRCKIKCADVANGKPACSARRCTIGYCNIGFEDCNRSPNDGCEALLAADPENCGQCANACASGSCQNGSCL
jgi:hypothetical protein